MRNLLRSPAVIAIALAFATSCGGGSTGPSGSTTLHLTLATPNADDGALMFTVRGPTIDTLTFPAGYTGYYRLSAGRDSATIIVAGHVAAGVIATMTAAGGSGAGSYIATVGQVAQRATFAQRGISGYGVTVGP